MNTTQVQFYPWYPIKNQQNETKENLTFCPNDILSSIVLLLTDQPHSAQLTILMVFIQSELLKYKILQNLICVLYYLAY